ncbi:MAG: M28 family peptidase [Acidobacteria bacterium]|nr:M28 family peptidase [Acidobacteriota bacterium]
MSSETLTGRAIRNRALRLAFPRYPGTEGDARAIRMVRSWFEVEGVEVAEERFSYDVRPAFRALRLLLLSSAVGVAAAAMLGRERPILGLATLMTVWVAGAVFLGWAPWLERIYRHDGPTRTANVVGVRRHSKPEGPPRMTLIILAHHDSKSQNLTLPFRAAFTGAALLGSLAMGAFLVARLAGGVASVLGTFLSAGVVCLSLVALATLRSGNRSPGGVDNAGSVAIVAELARVIPRETPEDVELVFLSPGAEEDHMVGAMRWLDRHADELSGGDVFAINLDGAGIPGRVALLERYGFGRRFSASLSDVARRAATDLGLRVHGTFLPPAMGVDAIPFSHRGIDCLTLASGSLCPAVAAIHSHRDRGENLDEEALENVARLARAMIRRLVDAGR